MEAAGTQKQTPRQERSPARHSPRRIGWQEFQKRYLTKETGYKYEWVDGLVEKTAYTMNPDQLYIQYNLQEVFMRLSTEGKVNGQLLAEADLLFAEKLHQRPDMAWLTRGQVAQLSTGEGIVVPAFVIEVISNHDAATRLAGKMENYRQAGVQVVWHIYPDIRQVHVYSGTGLRHSTVLSGDDLCSAAPALPDFSIRVEDIFKTA